jgi:DNA polymerase delta subunit 1
MLKHIQRDRKLRSYTLNSVSKLILGTTKVDMPYELIPEYQNGTDVQRAHLCYYCFKDAELVLQIMNKTMAMINSIEQARVTGVPLDFLLSRGAQVKTQSNLLQLCLKLGFVVPSSTEAENQDKTQGAIVLEPTPGLHRGFICTLDFGSLYPSIMQHRNLCYNTKLPLAEAKARYAPSQYYVPRYDGAKVAFVQRNIRQGLLPMLLERILAARNQAKAELKNAKDPFLKSVLDGRQLALKIVANSVYGFTKANMVCDKDIMEAVTAEGRWMILETKRIAEEEFGQRVIYGDTDSVFVLMPDKTLEECFQIGSQIAKRATEFFGAPHSLVVEKVFDGLLIGGKKRYGGKKYMSAKGKPELAVKGFECVRRDNALIASGTLEKCLDMILMQNNVQGAIDCVHAILRKLNQGTIDMSQLIISKCLSKTAAHYEESGVKQAHVELARKKAERGEDPPHTGDRVKYVIKAGHRKVKQKSLVAELAEDPLYMLQNGLAPNVDYYVEQQMMKPLVKIFTPILAPSERTWKINRDGEEVDLTLTEWTRLTAYKILFTGEHMRTIRGGGSNGLALSGFLVVGRRCAYCKQSSGAKTLCTSCRTSKGPEVLAHLVQKQNKAGIAYNAAWTRCQRCFGSLHVPVVCGNNDCDNFFHREAVKTRLTKVTADIEDLY